MFDSQISSTSSSPPTPGQTPPFMGYHRADGRVGTRNYWLVIPLFTGESQQLALLKEAILTSLGYSSPNPFLPHLRALRDQYRAGSYFQEPLPPAVGAASVPLFANIDGVKFLPGRSESRSSAGAMDSPGLDWADSSLTTAGIFWPVLAGYCTHPNVGGITLLCRTGATHYTDLLRTYIDRCDPAFAKPLLVADRMAYPTEFDWMTAATHDTFQAITVLNRQTRQPAPLSRLTIGIRCEQVGGFSAYPAISQYANLLAGFGATILQADAINTGLPTASHPCSRFQLPPEQGLSVFHLPGDATEITTALTAAGCTLHLSTMALARPMGNPIAPVARLAAAPLRPNRLPEEVDVDYDGDNSVGQTAETILAYSLKVASGEQKTLCESQGLDDFKVYHPEAY